MGIHLNPGYICVSFYGEKSCYCTLFNFHLPFVFSEKEAELLECPITGGLDALKKGQMATWVAGNKVG
jgi:hypothetical protein